MKQNKKIFYGWWIVAVCTLIMATIFTLMLACMSLYVVPVTTDLGISRGSFALISTIVSVISMLLSPLVGKYLSTHNIRPIMTVGLLISVLAYGGLSFALTSVHLYICAVIIGFGMSFSSVVAISILITRWFVGKRGIALSITFAGSSIGAMILSPILTEAIISVGWRVTMRMTGLAMLVFLVPLVFIVIRNSPELIGLKALGDDNLQQTQKSEETMAIGIPLAQLRRKPVFWLFVCGLFLALFTMGSVYHIPAHWIGVGFTSTNAAMFISVYSLVAIGGKLLMGFVFDRFGIKAGVLLGMVSMLLTFVMLLIAHSLPLLFVTAIFNGLGAGIGTIFPATLTSKIFGSKYYGETFGLINAFTSLSMALGNPIMATTYDATGNYNLAWYLGISAAALAAIILLIVAKRGKVMLESYKYETETTVISE